MPYSFIRLSGSTFSLWAVVRSTTYTLYTLYSSRWLIAFSMPSWPASSPSKHSVKLLAPRRRACSIAGLDIFAAPKAAIFFMPLASACSASR